MPERTVRSNTGDGVPGISIRNPASPVGDRRDESPGPAASRGVPVDPTIRRRADSAAFHDAPRGILQPPCPAEQPIGLPRHPGGIP